eukprot:IDg8850t1
MDNSSLPIALSSSSPSGSHQRTLEDMTNIFGERYRFMSRIEIAMLIKSFHLFKDEFEAHRLLQDDMWHLISPNFVDLLRLRQTVPEFKAEPPRFMEISSEANFIITVPD